MKTEVFAGFGSQVLVLLRPLCIVLQIGQGSLVGRLLSPEAASLLLLEHQIDTEEL